MYGKLRERKIFTREAYDRVPKEIILLFLVKKGISRRYIDIVKDMYDKAVIMLEQLGERFNHSRFAPGVNFKPVFLHISYGWVE